MVDARAIAIAFALAVSPVLAQTEARFDLVVSSDSIGVGEPLVLELVSDEPLEGGRRWNWPELAIGDSLPQGWEIVGASPLDSSASPVLEAGLRRVQRITVMAWDTGVKVIEPLVLTDSANAPTPTRAMLVEVGLVPLGENAVPKPMQGFKAYQWSWWERLRSALPWIMGGVGLLLMALWLYRKLSGRQVEEGIAPIVEAPEVPAHVTALAMLRKLEAEAPWQQGDGKETQSIVSEAVRLHLQGTFHVKALERTTDELARSLRQAPVRGLDAEQVDWMVALLQRSDLVKFAKQGMDGDAHLRVVKESIAWIEGSIPTSNGPGNTPSPENENHG